MLFSYSFLVLSKRIKNIKVKDDRPTLGRVSAKIYSTISRFSRFFHLFWLFFKVFCLNFCHFQGFLDENMEISQMTEGQQSTTSLKNLEVDKKTLEHYHDYFPYYVYLNKKLWSIIKFSSK